MAGILLISPDRDRARGLRSLVREDGHDAPWIKTIEQWPSAERDLRPELVIAAVPAVEPVLAETPRPPGGFPAPLLFVQSEAEFSRDMHLDERLVDRIESPFTSGDLLARIDALIRFRRVILRATGSGTDGRHRAAPGGGDGLGTVRSRLGALLVSRLPRQRKPPGPYHEVAARIAEWADRRDGFDPGHAERVATYCGMMADGLGLADGDAAVLWRAALLHDIGKAAIPGDLLRRRGPLEGEQMRLLRTHPSRGAALLRALDAADVVADTILDHHERIDGSGYHGKTDDRLSLTSRILAIAETFDAMMHSRVRTTLSTEAALDILRRDSGAGYDPDCVQALEGAIRPSRRSIPLSRFGPG